jgi:hypothetical protein
MEPQTRTGEPRASAFQWNAGGWFGSQLGSTLWLALLGGVLLGQGRASGWALLLAFAAANGVGAALWSARGRLAAYGALQTLVGVTGLCTLGALLALAGAGDLASMDPRFAAHPRRLFGVLLIFPALMALFALMERGARRASLPAGGGEAGA